MAIPLHLFPQHTIDQYNLQTHAKDGKVYVEIRKAIYGLPQAGILANKLLQERLHPHGYYEVPHTPGLWKHIACPISFTLVVDDFSIKYISREHVDHLLEVLKKHYKLAEDRKGELYCGIKLKWDYVNQHVGISMPGYVQKPVDRHRHPLPTEPQHAPHPIPPRTYGAESQKPHPTDESPTLDEHGIKRIQQIVGGILYYARAVDVSVLAALSTLAAEQTTATKKTNNKITQLLDYLATHPNATI